MVSRNGTRVHFQKKSEFGLKKRLGLPDLRLKYYDAAATSYDISCHFKIFLNFSWIQNAKCYDLGFHYSTVVNSHFNPPRRTVPLETHDGLVRAMIYKL